jgi:hypothetical protein
LKEILIIVTRLHGYLVGYAINLQINHFSHCYNKIHQVTEFEIHLGLSTHMSSLKTNEVVWEINFSAKFKNSRGDENSEPQVIMRIKFNDLA